MTASTERTGGGGPGPAEAAATRVVTFEVPDMDCASCAEKVATSVDRVSGVVDIDPRPTTGTVAVTFETGQTSADAVAEAIGAAGYEVVGRDDGTLSLSVPEMDCASCAGKVGKALDGVEGVERYETAPATGTVTVTLAGGGDRAAVVAAIESAGYEVEDDDSEDRESVWRSPRAKKTGLSAVFLAVGLVLEWVLTGLNAEVLALGGVTLAAADLLFLAAVAVGGQAILRNGYYSARNLSLDIDFLMSAAILAAITASVVAPGTALYSEAATLAVLFSVSELLERYAMDQTRDSLRELIDLSPDEATVIRGEDRETVPVEAVELGDVVAVSPGEKIPLDGVVVEGASAVNQAPITGESVPVEKEEGDEVYAGTINEEGYLEVEVTSLAGEDTLSQVIDLVEDAQADQTDREQFVERFAGYYTPVMVLVAIGVATVPPLAFGLPWVTWFVHGITMLVLACPCAFVISTPVSVVSGVTSAAKNGVLVKGGSALEAMGAVDAVAMDKTGTLTKGELTVTDVIPVGDRSEADVLECARGIETRSEHPIGEAIVAHGEGQSTPEVTDFQSLTGKGVKANLDGTPHYAGKPGLFDDLGFDLEHVHVVADAESPLSREIHDQCDREGCLNLVEDTIPRLQREGKTVVLVGRADELEGVVAVADEVRDDAAWMVQRLQSFGLDVVMLTGDNEGTARAIAEQVGVDDFRAELLPEDKVDAVEALQAEYGDVAMVGDGINDAPALARSTVGIAMGAAGTDTALETADIALLGDDLTKVPYLYTLSHRANGVIRQNIGASLGVKALLAVGVPLGYVTVALAVLVGDAGMTLGVTGNAMRLSRIEPERPE